ncbi:MAG: hypothetical protein K6G91_03435 [Kiritimatiellae bacterium]|nr:hypothetical protein [Kiritimatiellia bacterium]
MRSFLFWVVMISLVPGSMWGYGVIRGGLDARKGGPQPDREPADTVQLVVHRIIRSGYNYYFRNFSSVSNRERSTAAEVGF